MASEDESAPAGPSFVHTDDWDTGNSINVTKVNFIGFNRTKNDVVYDDVARLLEARTVSELLFEIRYTSRKLQNLEAFKGVGVQIRKAEVSENKKGIAGPEPLEVTYIVEECGLLQAKTGTEIGSSDTSANVSAKFRNVFGRGEQASFDYSVGTQTKRAMTATFSRPTSMSGDPRYRWQIKGWQTFRDLQQLSGHDEIIRGGEFSYLFATLYGQHRLSVEDSWREIGNIPPAASVRVHDEAGHSFKTSITHTMTADSRDHPILASTGTKFILSNELAGVLGGNVRFLKTTLDLEVIRSIRRLGLTVSLHFKTGFLSGLSAVNANFQTTAMTSGSSGGTRATSSGSTSSLGPTFSATSIGGDAGSSDVAGTDAPLAPISSSHLCDRFYLGGPDSLRGFAMRGVNPGTSEGYSLGGNAMWSTGMHVYTKIPGLGSTGLGDSIFTHGFVTAGGLSAGHRMRTMLMEMSGDNVRASMGAGLVLRTAIARVELSYCMPVQVLPSDQFRTGWHLGIGIDVL